MGAADVVPGVSGGTIAFITGIYEELLDSIRKIGPNTLKALLNEGIPGAWRQCNGAFLASIFGGIAISMVSFARMITWALENHPILVWSFFFGLVAASVVYIFRQLTSVSWREIMALAIGLGLAVFVSVARPVALPDYWWVVMLSGSVAICAMILPGISGSFILLLIGIYPVFIGAIESFNLPLIASFLLGCGVGLLAFSHVLSWLLKHYHNVTLALLTGFLMGSLNVIWPWKQILETTVDRHGEVIPLVQQNILPLTYESLIGLPSQLWPAIGVMFLGLFLVLGLEAISNNMSRCE
nr:DUF368 domain-containing protein [Marinibactrum halimedae]